MKKAVMIGTRFDTMGGIASVVNVYRDAGFFDRMNVRYLPSHCDGGGLSKLSIMMSSMVRLFVMLCRRDVSLVHVHMSSRASFWRKAAYLLLARAFCVPTIIHLHGSEFAIFYESECGALGQNAVRWFFDGAGSVIVLSETWRKWVCAISSNKNVVCIYNPVVVHDIQDSLKRDRNTILFLGRLGQRKGTYDLLRAAALIDKPFRLILAGDGDLAEVRALAEELKIAEKVDIAGWIRGDEKTALFERSSIYVLPSYNEGLPMGILEAMSHGLPVVSTPVGGIAEAVTNGVEGFLVTPGDVTDLADKLGRFLDDDDLRRKASVAARNKVVSTFSVEHILPRVEEIYRELGAKA
ncbi:glycosyltransferase family 4 protein [Methyloversatilis sp.]|uniref:glycosyltransferase family 4 protein n=1 Tax=Methyloversatilis sp. TaxID=2569862 RepID=UPI003F721E7B